MGLLISFRGVNNIRVSQPGLFSVYMHMGDREAKFMGLKQDQSRFVILRKVQKAVGDLTVTEIHEVFHELLAKHKENP